MSPSTGRPAALRAVGDAGRPRAPRRRPRAQASGSGRRDRAPDARTGGARGARGMHPPLAALLQHARGSAAGAGRHGGGRRLMRLAVAVAALALGASAAGAQRDSSWQDHDRAAHRAYIAGDFAAFRAELLAMRRDIGPLPAIDYDLAVAEARLGNGGRALEWLETFAGMGLFQDVASDSDLASVRSLDGYPRVVRQLSANLTPVTRGAVAFTLADADLVAEDIAYDSVRHRFLVSSVHRRKIVAVDSAGRATDFTRAGDDSTWGMFALHVDAARQLLWATTAAVRAAQGYSAADSGRSALLAYDLATGALRTRIEPTDSHRAHVLGDMTIGADGTVYVSDALSGAVYTGAPGRRQAPVRRRLRARHRGGRSVDARCALARPPGQRRAGRHRRALSGGQHAACRAERDDA